MPENEIRVLIDNLSENYLMKRCNGVFRTDQIRKTLFKSEFNLVEPTQIYLGIDKNGKERFCQYVSIEDTVKALLSQTSVKEQYLQAKSDTPTTPDVPEDLRDGKIRKKHIEIHC